MPTKIEWTDESWNPVTGCSHAGSPGCDHCYARRMARRLAGRYGYPNAPHHFDVTLHPDRLKQPLRWKKPRRIFVCSMSDLFYEDVPFEFVRAVFNVMETAHKHIFQVLTKRPRRMLEFMTGERFSVRGYMAPLANVWLGVSIENQATADERIPILLQIPAAVRYVSCEPLLGAIDLRNQGLAPMEWTQDITKQLDWVIVGGESGPNARPMHPDWARGIRDQCQAASVPFFMKQWGAWIPQILFPDIIPSPDGWGTLDGKGNWFPLTTPWNGRQGEDSPEREYVMVRVGKKAAGRLLDGQLWEEVLE